MPTQWIQAVKNSHQLTVFATSSVTKGPWSSVFTNALQEFNRLSGAMQLGVTFVPPTPSTPAPDPSSVTTGTNVKFDTANGSVHEDVLKNKFGQVLSSFTENVSGTAMIGLTKPPQWQDDKGQTRQFRAFIYVPATPMVNAGPTGQQIQRGVGDGVKLFIAVHELIHACGLSNGDHSTESDPDVFVAKPQPLPGATPQGDKLMLRLQPQVVAPPIIISTRTAGLIRSIWT